MSLTLALSSTIFVLYGYTTFRPLNGVSDSARLSSVSISMQGQPASDFISQRVIASWRHSEIGSHVASFESAPGAVAIIAHRVTATEEGQVVKTDGSLFSLLALKPYIGRFYCDCSKDEASAVVSFEFWKTYLRQETNLTDVHLKLDGKPYDIVGVAPRNVRFPLEAHGPIIWIKAETLDGDDGARKVIYRADTKDASPAMMAVMARLAVANSPLGRIGRFPKIVMEPYGKAATKSAKPYLICMLISAVVLWLLGFFSLVGDHIVEQINAEYDLAVRLTMGAPIRQVMRPILSRLLMSSSVCIVISSILSWLLIGNLRESLAWEMPWLQVEGLRSSAVGTNILSGIMFAVGLGVMCSSFLRGQICDIRESPNRYLKRDRPIGLARLTIAAVQVGLAFCCITTALMLAYHISQLRTATSTVQTDQTAIASVRLDVLAPDEALAVYRNLLVRLKEDAEVENVALVTSLPYLQGPKIQLDVNRSGAQVATMISAMTNSLPGVVGMKVLEGRSCEAADDRAVIRYAVINKAFSQSYFPYVRPVGRMITLPGQTELYVIGVVDDGVQSLGNGQSQIYLCFSQLDKKTPFVRVLAGGFMQLLVKSKSSPERLEATLHKLIQVAVPNLSIGHVRTMREALDESFGMVLLANELISFTAIIIAACAMFSIYNLCNLLITSKRRELALRIAMGAPLSRLLAAFRRELLTALLVALSTILIGIAIVMWVAYSLLGWTGALHQPRTLLSTCGYVVFIIVLSTIPAVTKLGKLNISTVLKEN